MKRFLTVIVFAALVAAFVCPCGCLAADKRAITFDDMISMGRIGSFEISPDGELIVFTVTWFDKENNSSNTDIYLASVKDGNPRRFVKSAGNDYSPCWSHDGRMIAFVSDRDGTPQIWTIPVDGGESRKVTDVPTGVSDPLWSPDGKTIAFTSRVYPECLDMECNGRKLEEFKNSKVKARVIDQLLYRHWNHWREGRWSHLFLADTEGEIIAEANTGETDVPPISLGGERDYAFSPDGSQICFTMNPDEMVATSTNNDLYIMDLPDGEPKSITSDNLSNDNNPRYSPDGRYIAYRAQLTPKFEADRYRLMLYDRKSGKRENLTENFDYSIAHFCWGPDSRTIYFNAENEAQRSIGKISIEKKNPDFIIRDGFNMNLRVAPNGKHIIFSRQDISHPTELFRATDRGRDITRLTGINDKLVSELEMNDAEYFWFDGAEGHKVHGLLVKPPFFDRDKKYPMVMLIHGGPQGSFGNEFHYRWNVQMFASPGYVVAMVNFTGSTGYGQQFTNDISGDWGGRPYIDIMKGTDYVLENYPFIDESNIGAAGASYGGFMINWIEGHTDRFNCLVSHDGVYDQVSMYGATEELWFPEWEMKGTPWENPEMYRKFSPSTYAANFKTPCLVVHGENDFRVPYTQGLQMFTALQRQGVESRLLYYPDEDHFVRKPLNAELWWGTIHDWFEKYLK